MISGDNTTTNNKIHISNGMDMYTGWQTENIVRQVTKDSE